MNNEMIVELTVIFILVLLFIYGNPIDFSNAPKMPMWDRITFNPFMKAAECPIGCENISLTNSDLTPSILIDVLPQKWLCGYQKDSIVYPCPSRCCGSVSLLGRLLGRKQ